MKYCIEERLLKYKVSIIKFRRYDFEKFDDALALDRFLSKQNRLKHIGNLFRKNLLINKRYILVNK